MELTSVTGATPPKYRMYVDEVGNPDMGSSEDPNHRYLSLTGVILGLDLVASTLAPAFDRLKAAYFGSHPDDPVILHRKELVNRKYPFQALRNRAVEARFNAELLALLDSMDYVVITATIDKLQHQQQYSVWRFDPYHYCMTVLVERFAMWLRRRDLSGDVMAESRGSREDRRLQDSFARIVTGGTEHLSAETFGTVLTSRQLKTKPKSNNIAGLQLADLVAHPSYKAMLAERLQQPAPKTFGTRVSEILELSKYDRSAAGRIDGWGRKWLP